MTFLQSLLLPSTSVQKQTALEERVPPYRTIHCSPLRSPPSTFHFIVSNPNRMTKSVGHFEKAAEQCVYWVGEIKYCTIAHTRGAGENCTHAQTHDIRLYWKWRRVFSSFCFVCAALGFPPRTEDLISSRVYVFTHADMANTERGFKKI